MIGLCVAARRIGRRPRSGLGRVREEADPEAILVFHLSPIPPGAHHIMAGLVDGTRCPMLLYIIRDEHNIAAGEWPSVDADVALYRLAFTHPHFRARRHE